MIDLENIDWNFEMKAAKRGYWIAMFGLFSALMLTLLGDRILPFSGIATEGISKLLTYAIAFFGIALPIWGVVNYLDEREELKNK